MSKVLWAGRQLHDLSRDELAWFERDVSMARAAVVDKYGESVASVHFDEDLAEIRDAMAAEQVEPWPLITPNPFMGQCKIGGEA